VETPWFPQSWEGKGNWKWGIQYRKFLGTANGTTPMLTRSRSLDPSEMCNKGVLSLIGHREKRRGGVTATVTSKNAVPREMEVPMVPRSAEVNKPWLMQSRSPDSLELSEELLGMRGGIHLCEIKECTYATEREEI